jgi:hypothetical protein
MILNRSNNKKSSLIVNNKMIYNTKMIIPEAPEEAEESH